MNEANVAVGICILLVVLFLLFNPEILIGIVVYATAAILSVGGFAILVILMFLVLKQIFR